MRKWFVYDTTLRDGLQEHGREISILDAKNFAKKLDALGFTWLEAGFASAGEDQMSRIKELVRLNLKNTKISAFGRTRGKKETVENATDLNAILLSGVKTATIVGKARKRDVINSLKADLQTNLSMVFESIQYLKEKGLEVIFDAEHFFDGLVDNKEYTLKILEVADKAGADWLVLCDTNGASTEQMIKKGIESAKSCCPINKFGFHAHNDRNRAISNSEMAFHCGISHIQGTINGYGERCGNTDLSILIPNLYFDPQAMALKDSKSLEMLTSLAETTAEYLNANLRNNHPWVGSRAGYTEAGMHTSGILRDPTSYIHADLRKVGNKMTFGVSEQSGKSSIAIKAEEFGVALTKEQIEMHRHRHNCSLV
jgi:2-isopropylmalate synthase